MAHVTTTGGLPKSTGVTGTLQPLTGKADYIHIRVDGVTYMTFRDSTGSTGSGTGIGLILTTGDVHTFVAGKPGPKYISWVATSTAEFAIVETF
jgi:hypothetical protein